MIKTKWIAIAFLALGVTISSCDKDDDKDGGTSTPVAKNVMLVVKPMIGDMPIQLNTDYNLNGQMVNFNFLKFYVSGIEMSDDAGTILADNDGLPILATTEQNGVIIGTTTEEHFHMLQFNIGLDSLTNHSDPVTAPDPLSDTEMHWNWNPAGGYKFLRMEGTVDGVDFISHAATDALFQEGMAVGLHDVNADGDHIHMELLVDFAVVFDGISIPGTTQNHGPTPFNTSYMDAMGVNAPYSIQ